MTITEFTKAYQTSDGRVFVKRDDAERHERKRQVDAWVFSVLKKHTPTYGEFDFMAASALVDELAEAGFVPPVIEFDSSSWTGSK